MDLGERENVDKRGGVDVEETVVGMYSIREDNIFQNKNMLPSLTTELTMQKAVVPLKEIKVILLHFRKSTRS